MTADVGREQSAEVNITPRIWLEEEAVIEQVLGWLSWDRRLESSSACSRAETNISPTRVADTVQQVCRSRGAVPTPGKRGNTLAARVVDDAQMR